MIADEAGRRPAAGIFELRGDAAARAAVAFLAAVSVLSLVPWGGEEARARVFEDFVGPLVVALAAALFAWRWRHARGPEARRFWLLLAAAFGAWLAESALGLGGGARSTAPYQVAADTCFALFYLMALLASGCEPDRPAGWSRGRTAYRLEVTGTAIFLTALAVYFVFLPASVDPERYQRLSPGFFLIVFLDVALAVRFSLLARRAAEPGWRTVYGLLALAFGSWSLLDTAEGLMSAGWIPTVAVGTPLDILWNVPFLAVFLAARAPAATGGGAAEEGESGDASRINPLTVFAFVLPALHFALYGLGWLASAARVPRELLVLATLVTICGLALIQHRHMVEETRRLRLENRAARKTLVSSQRLESVGQLAGGIAHDFNNLLTVIGGYSSLALAKVKRAEPVERELKQIAEAGERAAELTGQLLAFSRRQPLDPEPLDLNEVVETLEPMLRRTIPESIVVETHLEPELPALYLDRGRIEQVLLDLVLNARDAMPGGGRLEIGTRRESATGGVELWVADDGIGIAAADLDHVFEPFYTTKGPREGTGLGLASVYGTVRQSRGEIAVESAPGAGSRFRIRFPLPAADASTP